MAAGKRIQVVAVGNPLRGDDGVAMEVLEALRGMALPDNIGLVDAGSDPLDVTHSLMDADKVIVMDAASMNKPPGHIAVLKPEQLREALVTTPSSTHIYGVEDGIRLARAAGFNPEVRIIGIQPEDTSERIGLSRAVADGVPKIIKIVLEEVAS